jgi:ribosomal protein L11 methyltransferase
MRDDFSGLLWAAGSEGHEETETGVDAFFADATPQLDLPAAWLDRGVHLVAEERVLERDWQEPFRRGAQPFAVGRRLVIDPGDGERRTLLQIPARSAFGTGTHESTRLALEALDDLDLANRSVLDAGCGTGVLGFAALALGARRAVGFDVDPVAAVASRENARRNGIAGWAGFAGGVEALRPAARLEVLLLNVIPDEARPLLGPLAQRLVPGAAAVISGFLGTEAASWSDELRIAGFDVIGRLERGEWMAFRARRR